MTSIIPSGLYNTGENVIEISAGRIAKQWGLEEWSSHSWVEFEYWGNEGPWLALAALTYPDLEATEYDGVSFGRLAE
jgi:hypothetical protein